MKIILVLSEKLSQDAKVGDTTKAVYRFYVSTDPCTGQTAEKLFGKQELVEETLLDEVLPAKESEQGKEQSVALVNKLEEVCEDCVLVSHENKIKALMAELKRRGYLIEKPRLFGIQPLDRIRATKKSMHCGGCQHNCMLNDPKCDVGKDRAIVRGIK